MTNPRPHSETTGSLISEVLAGFSSVVRGEVALARAEAGQSVRAASRGMIHLAAGAVFGLTAMNVLAAAGVMGLVALGLGPLAATALAAAVLLLLAAGFLQYGGSLLRPESLRPRHLARSLRADAAALQRSNAP